MMRKIDKLVQRVIDGFQSNKGKSSLYCFDFNLYKHIVLTTIVKFHNKYPNEQILINVEDNDLRIKLKGFLNQQNIDVENGYDIKVLTNQYINIRFYYLQKLVIIINKGYNYTIVDHFANTDNKFVLCIFTKHIDDAEFIIKIRKRLPNIDVADLVNEVNVDRIYSPVEEHRCGIDLDEQTQDTYGKYSEYISNCVSIFGNLDVLTKCRTGDIPNNISAANFRYNLAIANGWRKDLDLSNPFNADIDKYYNPLKIEEYATNFYNFTRTRRELVSDYKGKLKAIKEICDKHKGDKIVIVSLRGEFAAEVTNYINNNTEYECGDYHDCLDEIYAYNEYGEPIVYKSGTNKGKQKVLGSQAQSTLNESRFNANLITLLSIKNASNTQLKIACDVVIFTSPMCANIVEFKKRYKNVIINNSPNLIYTIFCNNTIETEKFNTNFEQRVQYNVINEYEYKIEYDDENNFVLLM